MKSNYKARWACRSLWRHQPFATHENGVGEPRAAPRLGWRGTISTCPPGRDTMAAARPRVSGISGETAMTVDDVKNYLAGPDGPLVVLLALTVLFSIPRYACSFSTRCICFCCLHCGETLRVYVDGAIRNYLWHLSWLQVVCARDAIATNDQRVTH
jgi:hypothetical protein